MHSIFYYAVAVLLLVIAIEDLRHRKIRVLWFVLCTPLLAVAAALESTPLTWIMMAAANVLTSVLILSIGILIVALRNSLRFREALKMTGAGDLLMIFLLCITFSMPLMLMVLLTSLLASLAFFAGCRLRGATDRNVPLAGITAIVFTLTIVYTGIINRLSPGDPGWIVEKILSA